MRPPYSVSISKGVRNLLLGRVLLKSNMAAGATTIPVGDTFASPYANCSTPGANLFYNNTTAATLVQPAATNLAGSISYQENVTLVEGLPNALDAVASTGVTYAYTTARGAYLRLTTLPSVCSNMRFIEADFLDEGLPPPQDTWFPAALVMSWRCAATEFTNVQRLYRYTVVVRYARVMNEDYDRETFQGELEDLCDLLEEDLYLGGTCTWREVTVPVQMNPTPGRVPNRQIQTASGKSLDWGDIQLAAYRNVIVDKTYS